MLEAFFGMLGVYGLIIGGAQLADRLSGKHLLH
jgi:hypothetical protein